MFELSLSVLINDMDEWTRVTELCEATAVAAGGTLVSAGTGFGARDMQFEFRTREAAEEAEALMHKTGLTFESIGITDLSEEPDEYVM